MQIINRRAFDHDAITELRSGETVMDISAPGEHSRFVSVRAFLPGGQVQVEDVPAERAERIAAEVSLTSRNRDGSWNHPTDAQVDRLAFWSRTRRELLDGPPITREQFERAVSEAMDRYDGITRPADELETL